MFQSGLLGAFLLGDGSHDDLVLFYELGDLFLESLHLPVLSLLPDIDLFYLGALLFDG